MRNAYQDVSLSILCRWFCGNNMGNDIKECKFVNGECIRHGD